MRTIRMLAACVALAFVSCLNIRAAEIPRPAPEFAIRMSDGSQLLLSQFKGKVVVLVFLYTTCPHCQRTTQVLSPLQTEFASRGLQILGVAFNPNADQLVPSFMAQFHPTFPVGSSARESVMDYLQQSPAQPGYVPEVVFIDRKRVIRAQFTGEDPFFNQQEKNFRERIEALLTEPVSTPRTSRAAARRKQS